MSKNLRKRSSYLIFPILFVTALAFAYELILPVIPGVVISYAQPDSTYTRQTTTDSVYQKLLGSITELYNQKRYPECLVLLKQANTIKPNVLSVQERIIRVEGLIAQQNKTEAEYTRMITMADDYFAKKDYLNAKAAYQMAIDTKPDDAYARERMNMTMDLLRSNKAQNILYDVTLASADKLFAEKEYEKARSQYQNASAILPGEAYPKEKINAIIKIQVDLQVREELYRQAITAADNYYGSKSFNRALLEYQKALQQKPAEPYPQERITELTQLLADLAALEEAYNEAISSADQLFTETRYPDARSGYEEALALKPKEAYPSRKISEIDEILARIAKNNADFEKFVNLADSFYMDKNFIRARQNYQLALQIKPNESYPRAMLEKTSAGVGTQEANEMAMEEAYNSAISNADRLFAGKALGEAKAEYENALAIKPEEAYPQQKISEIGTLLEAALLRQQELDAQYSRVVENADRMFSDNIYSQAREQYQAALKLKPDAAYPAEKIVELDGILANLEAQRAIDAQYKTVLAGANKLFSATTYEPAKTEYLKALAIKPTEKFPAERIHTIDSILLSIANSEALESNYAALIAAADEKLGLLDYQAARKGYQEAIGLKPKESYPAAKVKEIDALLNQIVLTEKLEAEYNLAITRADSLLEARAYQQAKGSYQAASDLKPQESYPGTKITEIDIILTERARLLTLNQQYDDAIASADQLFSQSAWQQARGVYVQAQTLKPEEPYPAQQLVLIDRKLEEIAQLNALSREYQETIASAEKFFGAAIYDSARITFLAAQNLKPEETLPGIRIAQIDSILTLLADQKALDERYAALISSTDKLLAGKDYQAARAGYTQAMALKPSESYPAVKVTEIDGILAEIERVAALELQYARAVARGDSLMLVSQLISAELLTAARGEFETASSLKPGEAYPKAKLEEIETALQKIASRQALDMRYQEEIATADGFFSDKSWDPAVAAYKRASDLKPSETYPGQKITQIDSIRQELARQLKIDSDYKALIANADQFFSTRVLDSARVVYARAGELRPEKAYWQEQIAEIDRILAEIQRVNNEYLAAVSGADQLLSQQRYEDARGAYQDASQIKPSETYPREKIKEINETLAEIQGRRQTFDKLVVNGDLFFTGKEYFKAKENFQQALELFPDEEHPKERLRIANVKIDSIYRANKADYDKAVGEGDGFFNTYEYDKSIDAFTRAIAFLPNEDYPRMMIAKIRKTIAENAIADVLSTTVVIKAGEEQKFSFDPVNISSRRNNFIYLKVKNLSDNSFNILMRYGKGDQTSGGLAIRNISTDGEINERLISVKDQDPWYREDNNWISLYPQGGDIEVSFIQVSRAIN